VGGEGSGLFFCKPSGLVNLVRRRGGAEPYPKDASPSVSPTTFEQIPVRAGGTTFTHDGVMTVIGWALGTDLTTVDDLHFVLA